MLRDRFWPTSQSVQNPERARKTHANPATIAAIGKLSTELKIKLNYRIETSNDEHYMKTFKHSLGNASRPGSPTASFVSVDTVELDKLRKEPNLLKRVLDY
ncbi:hypothetical protein BDP27DRAFT_1244341, partial [Rhodocollybia butyracea]